MHLPNRIRSRAGHVGAALLAGALALAVSLSMSHYLNRDLLGEFNDASRLLEWQQSVSAELDTAASLFLDLSRQAATNTPPAAADAAARWAIAQRHLARAAEQLSSPSPGATGVPPAETLSGIRALAMDPAPHGALLLAGALRASQQLATLGRAVRMHHDTQRLAQQGAMIRLRTRTVVLSHLMCLMFSLVAAAATFGVLLARREGMARREVDDARRDAVAAGARAEAAGHGKSRFLGMLSHELLTPLQSIISSMDIIESRGRVEAGEPLFLRLRDGTRSLRGRLSDLVDFAKMSAGSLAVNPRKFRLDRLVEEVIADHEEAVLRKDLDIHWEPDAELQRPVVTDPRRVRQILDNLVSNAIKYTARGGVTVCATVERVDGHGSRLNLEVRDTGTGIAADALPHIFDPFFRVASTATLADGSGLGLAVVRSLVELLKGQLHVESVPGSGSRFVVWLPIATSAPLDVAAPPPTGLPAVLVVDDAHDVRAGIAEVLRSLGYAPSEAGSAREALRALEARSFSAVLLDLDLPDMTGGEVARRTRQGEGPNRGTRLVMLSAAHAVEGEVERWFDARADKPVTAAQLRRVLAPAVAHA